jgi:hypothetical protein
MFFRYSSPGDLEDTRGAGLIASCRFVRAGKNPERGPGTIYSFIRLLTTKAGQLQRRSSATRRPFFSTYKPTMGAVRLGKDRFATSSRGHSPSFRSDGLMTHLPFRYTPKGEVLNALNPDG